METKKKAGIERPYTIGEFCEIISKITKERNIEYFDKLDYFLPHEREEELTSNDISLHSYTNWGASEGVYTDFYAHGYNKKFHIFTAKTLGEDKSDYIAMHTLAANICLIAREYIRNHDDEFNWIGYNVYIVEDGKPVPYQWCSTEEGARESAGKLIGFETIIRNNKTREIMKTIYIVAIAEYSNGELNNCIITGQSEQEIVDAVNHFFKEEEDEGHPIDAEVKTLSEIDGLNITDTFNDREYFFVAHKTKVI